MAGNLAEFGQVSAAVKPQSSGTKGQKPDLQDRGIEHAATANSRALVASRLVSDGL